MSININGYLNKYQYARKHAFDVRNELDWKLKASLALAFAILTAVAAQVRIYVGSPVPITLQVFTVLLAGVVLGKYWGGLSQGMYIGMGAAGLHVFSNFQAGPETLMGVTGGYIFGFLIAAFLIGHVVDSYPKARKVLPMLGLMFVGVGIIYTLGAIQLALVLHLTLTQTYVFGIAPFIGVDIAKAIGASLVGTMILPKK
jgi:biotin transport system substrate-specific component